MEAINLAKVCPNCGSPLNDEMKFCAKCGTPVQADGQPPAPSLTKSPPQQNYPQPQNYPPQQNYNAPPVRHGRKDKTTAGILGILLGGLGVHKFYLGNTTMGVIYLLTCWTFIPGIIGLIEGIKYLTMSQEEFDAKYNGIY